MSEKTLKELSKEYESAALIISERIARKKAELRRLKNSICSNGAYKLKSELKILYAELKDTSETAEYLKSYYEPHEGRKELFSYK